MEKQRQKQTAINIERLKPYPNSTLISECPENFSVLSSILVRLHIKMLGLSDCNWFKLER